MQTITFDDTLYQLVPKETVLAAIDKLQRYRQLHGGEYVGGVEFTRLISMLSAAPTPPAQPAERKPLTADDVFTLTGQAVVMKNDGKTDMPAYFFGLAERIAETIGDEALANRTRELCAAHGIKGES